MRGGVKLYSLMRITATREKSSGGGCGGGCGGVDVDGGGCGGGSSGGDGADDGVCGGGVEVF